MINEICRDKLAIMPTYNRMFRFNLLIHFLVFMPLYQNDSYSFSVLISVQQTEHLYSSITTRNNCKRLLQGKSGKVNTIYTFWMIFCTLYLVSCTWLIFLLLLAGDIHRNPNPSTSSSLSSISSFKRVCTLCIPALIRTSVSGILSCHLIFRSFLRQLVWKWFSLLACRW